MAAAGIYSPFATDFNAPQTRAAPPPRANRNAPSESRSSAHRMVPKSKSDVTSNRKHLSSWMSHDMAPADPYGKRAPRSKSMPPITRQSAAPSKIIGGGRAEMNTGGEKVGANTLYQPSGGEPQRSNRFKGFLNNPDKERPRDAPNGSSDRVFPKNRAHVLGLKPQFQPPRAEPGETDKTFGERYRASDHKDKKFNVKSHDGIWKPIQEVEAAHDPHAAFRVDALSNIQQVANERAAQKADALRVKQEDKRRMQKYDPWTKNDQRLAAKRLNKTSIEVAQQAFDVEVGQSTYVGQKMLKNTGAGAPLIIDGQVQTGMKYDAETHLRNAYKSTQQSASAVVVYSREEHRGDRESYREVLQQQMQNDRQRRAIQREASNAQKEADQGSWDQFQKQGGGAPQRMEDGSVRTLVQGGLAAMHLKARRPDFELRDAQLTQINASKDKRAKDKNPVRFMEPSNYDVFEKATVVRDADGKIKGHKNYTNVEIGMVAPNVVVKGATLANVMGTPGGGARFNMHTTKMPAMMENEAYWHEAKAQAAGESVWNKSGGGGPLRNDDGTINTKTLGKAVQDVEGITDMRSSPDYHSRIAQIRRQQQDYLKSKTKERKKEVAADKRLEAKVAKEEFMSESHNPHHVGPEIPERFVVKKKDLYGREKPPPNASMAATYEAQIKEKENKDSSTVLSERQAEISHNKLGNKWEGHGYGNFTKVEGDDTTGHVKRPIDIHAGHGMDKMAAYDENVAKDQKKYHKELNRHTREKKRSKKTNKSRKVKEEMDHLKSEHKFLDRPGGGAPLRLKNGKIKTARGTPKGDPGEYKMLVPTSTTLA